MPTPRSGLAFVRRAGRAASQRTWPALVVAAAVLLLFHEPVLHGRIAYEWDTTYFYHPLAAWFSEQLRAGRIPLWSPHLFGGYPIFADGETGMLAPLLLPLYLLLPFEAAFVWSRVAHVALAGFGMLVLARTLGLGRLGATIAALVLALGSFFVAQLHHENVVRTAAWLPLVIAGFELALRRAGRARAFALVGSGLALGASGLGLHPQFLALNLLALALFAALRAAFGLPQAGGLTLPGRFLTPALLGGAAAALGLGLSAVQTLPLYELGQQTQRGAAPDYGYASSYALTPPDLLGLLFPYFFRSGAGSWSLWPYWETTLYVGVAPFLLAALALGFVRTRVVGLFAALGLIGLLIALGDHAPINLFHLLWQLPGFGSFRAPGRYTLLVVFALAVLAGLGADWVQTPGRRRRALQVALLAGLAAVVGLGLGLEAARAWALGHPAEAEALIERHYLAIRHEDPALAATTVRAALLQSLQPLAGRTAVGLGLASASLLLLLAGQLAPRGAAIWRALLVVLVGADLLTFALEFHPRQPIRDLERPARAATYLRTAAGGTRVITPWSLRPIAPNRLILQDVMDVSGYSSLPPRRYQVYWERARQVEDELLDAWGVHYVVRPPGRRPPATADGVAFDPDRPLLHGVAGSPLGEETFRVPTWPTTELRVVSALTEATELPAGAEVAEIVANDASGRSVRVTLRAGRETAEVALDHPEVRAAAHHGPARVAHATPAWLRGQPFALQLYGGAVELPEPLDVVELTVRTIAPIGRFRLHGLALAGPSGLRSLGPADKAKYELAYRDEQVEVLHNAAAFPRAYVVSEAVFRSGSASQLDLMCTRPFDPATEVVLDSAPGPPQPSRPAGRLSQRSGRVAQRPQAAEVVLSESDRVVVAVRSDRGGYLVLTDAYYPGWRAFVDGVEVPVLRANELFRAVHLEPGTHRVEFVFDPPSVRLGAAVSLGTLALALAVLALAGRGRAGPRAVAGPVVPEPAPTA